MAKTITNYNMISKKNNFTSEKTINEKILIEKRKRFQTYITLDHLLTFNSYFDFFSSDAFQIAKHSKYLAQSYQTKKVTSEFLLYPFFEMESELSKILEEYKITKVQAKNILPKKAEGFSFQEDLIRNFRLTFLNKKVSTNKSITYSPEVNLLFEKAVENAQNRFKTPIITPEILFITLMEQKNCKAGKFLFETISNPLDWYLLRYKLLKRIHTHELNIRSQVKKNEQYFAYLLKTQISELQFDRLIENDLLPLGVLFFRNQLLNRVLGLDFINCLEKETLKTIKATSTRKYSL